ncbi:MAG: DUF1232 domain-containing protein [Chloroflexi bacterium]|nr:DUF1232 domain-containing protein [Chloroflexota bacterium]
MHWSVRARLAVVSAASVRVGLRHGCDLKHHLRVDLRILAVIVGSLLAVWLLFVAILWVFRPRGAGLGQLVRIVPDVLRLVRNLLADRRTPVGVRLALIGLLAWLINPIDLIPEFIPILGPLDDVVVAILVLRYVRRRLGTDELRRRWPGTEEGYALLSGVLGRSRPEP